jgi:diguanylate cyclase (GGDEF)-like protein
MKQMRMLRHPIASSSFAAILVIFAAALRGGPLIALEGTAPWPAFYPAVVLAAFFGGPYAGMVATALACFGVTFLWSFFNSQPFINTQADLPGMLVFISISGILSSLCSASRRTQERLESYDTLIKSLDEGFCVIEMVNDLEGEPIDYRFIECNSAFEQQTGLHSAEGKTICTLIPDFDRHWIEIYGNVARTGKSVRFENSAAALRRHFDVFAFRIDGSRSDRVGILFRDVTRRKKSEQDLMDLAFNDILTGLPNRVMCRVHLAKALARAERGKQKIALLFIDLDGFKAVNDTLGHQAGDRLLRKVAERLTSTVRAGELVCRFGGDEFTVILENCQPELVPGVAARINRVLELPIHLDGEPVQISASIGFAIYPDSAFDEDSLIKNADAAMYSAKSDRKLELRL